MPLCIGHRSAIGRVSIGYQAPFTLLMIRLIDQVRWEATFNFSQFHPIEGCYPNIQSGVADEPFICLRISLFQSALFFSLLYSDKDVQIFRYGYQRYALLFSTSFWFSVIALNSFQIYLGFKLRQIKLNDATKQRETVTLHCSFYKNVFCKKIGICGGRQSVLQEIGNKFCF